MTSSEAPDLRNEDEQRLSVMSELEALVGRIVVNASIIDYSARATVAVLTHPLEMDLRQGVETGLHSKHGGELAVIVRRKLKSAGAGLGVTSAQFKKFLTLWSWYGEVLVEQRNRLVHDVYVFGLAGDDFGLARIVTAKGCDHRPVPAGLTSVRELADDFVVTRMLALKALQTLSSMAEGTFIPPPGK